MRNAGLEEAQVEIKIAGRSINNLRYADDTTLMTESEEELFLRQHLCGSKGERTLKRTVLHLRPPFPSASGQTIIRSKALC